MPPGVWDDDYQRRGRLYRGEVRLPTVPPGARVIDLGCGDGRALYALTGRCSSAVGVDSARSALALCRESRQFPPLDLVLADVGCLPFRDRSFDLVLLFHVIGHGYQVERSSIASEVVRMCAPGGQIHLRVFSKEDFRATKGDLVEDGTRLRKNGLLTHYFTEDEVASLFPGMTPLNLETVRWSLRIRGASLMRAEIQAVFRRPSDLIRAPVE